MSLKYRKLISAVMLFVTAAFLLTSFTGCGKAAKNTVVVAGSTSVQPFAELLAEEFGRSHKGVKVDVQGGGSSAGITAVRGGIANIGMSSRDLKESEKDLWYTVIAHDKLALIINPKNPVANLGLQQVRDIYSGKITNWNQLPNGVKGEITVITREEGSGTRTAFEDLIMDKDNWTKSGAVVFNSNGAIRLRVSHDPNAIGFISLGLVEIKGQRAVKAITLDGEPAESEAYKLSRPFLFIAKTEPQEGTLAKEFIDYVLSADGQKRLKDEGLTPVNSPE